jgi:hypothetical protein
MFDVFYIGNKPNLFVHERKVESVEQAQQQSRTGYFWMVSYLVDYTGFDFLWKPVPWQSHQCHAWSSQHQKDAGTYLVPKQGYSEINYRKELVLTRLQDRSNWTIPENFAADSFDFSWHPDATEPDYVYQFGTQHQRTGGPVYTVPGATNIKYVQHPRSIKTTVDSYWTVPSGTDTGSFDWTWHPDATEPDYVYQFGTQHQRTGGPVYTVPGATKIKYVEQIKIKVDSTSAVIVEIDHQDGNTKQIANTVKTVRYFDNYRDTLIRIAKSLVGQHEFVWVCSSICDYTDFDFSWHPEQWQATMLHVFASNEQKFGDTFYMHVPSFAEHAEHRVLLEWYDCNFVSVGVPRRPIPVVQHDLDSHVLAVHTQDFSGPLAVYSNGPLTNYPTVNLWRAETKTIVPLSAGASSVIVPRAAVPYIKTQLYDYPYIDKTQRIQSDSDQDVVFISNGESMAEQNWNQLRSQCNRAKRSDGVTGREAAYKAAAAISTTPWFFAVFAKTEVLPDFKFDYQPDRMQQPKHYIFHSRNPLNGLEYGAMNINLYNRQLVLDTVPGLDFTLSAAHDVVPICASISRFNTDPWITWRSAFREVVKLQREVDLGADVEIEYRLRTWKTVAVGENAEWCLQGSQDAAEFYDSVKGDYEQLRLSFDWAWLQEYYYSRYHTRPWLELG